MHAEALARAGALTLGPRKILGIAGAPGAGKSTLAEELIRALGEDRAVLVPMDGFHLANEVLDAHGSRDRKGAPGTFDSDGYVAALQRIRNGQTVYVPRFDRNTEQSIAAAIEVPPHVPLVITEGNYLLLQEDPWARVRPLLDEAWYLDVPDDERIAGLIARHQSFGKTDEQAREWVTRSDEQNAAVVKTTAASADWRITSFRAGGRSRRG